MMTLKNPVFSPKLGTLTTIFEKDEYTQGEIFRSCRLDCGGLYHIKGINAIKTSFRPSFNGIIKDSHFYWNIEKSVRDPFQELIPKLTDYLNSWLQEFRLLPTTQRVIIERLDNSLFSIKVEDSSGQIIKNIKKDGSGLLQITNILLLFYSATENGVLMFEYPELYLHPKSQAILIDFFLLMAKEKKLSIFVLTYCHFLLRRIQRNIAEERYTCQDVNLFYSESVNDMIELKALNLDKYGNISNFPNDLFADEMFEIASTQKAILKRQLAT
jgi:hypothetical protein